MKPWSIKHHFFSTIDSTNTWSKLHAFPQDENDVIIVKADEQSEGRGQHGRIWVSPPGCNLYQSYTFLLPSLENAMHVAQVLCLSALHTLQGLGIPARVKWPNDVFVEGKKIGGVLCEITEARCIAGIGINLNISQKDVENIPQPAISTKILLGKDISVDDFATSLNERFLEDLSILLKQGFAPFYTDYLNYLLYLNQIVRWTLGDETHIARFKGIDPKGRAILFLEDLETDLIVHSGQIRPAETYNS